MLDLFSKLITSEARGYSIYSPIIIHFWQLISPLCYNKLSGKYLVAIDSKASFVCILTSSFYHQVCLIATCYDHVNFILTVVKQEQTTN